MSNNVIKFCGKPTKAVKPPADHEEEEPWVYRRKNRIHGPNMHTYLFRSYDLIMESDEADLVRDVSCDVDKAQTKLKALRRRLKSMQKQVQMLTTTETKLAAAIVAAVLSGQR